MRKAKRYLENYRRKAIELHMRKDQLKDLREEFIYIKGFEMDKIKVQNQQPASYASYETSVDDIVMLESEIIHDIVNLQIEKDEVLKILKGLEKPEHMMVLEERYVKVKSWRAVCAAMRNKGYVYAQEYVWGTLHKAALDALEGAMEHVEKC